MKRIAIFCDGTWNRLDAAFDTNVEKLMRAVAPRAPDGIEQVAVYVPGVGTGRGATRLARTLDRLGGGAFGWGLTRNIETAYRALAERYAPGDEIFIFGFSRGGYTARSLAGLIRNCGLPPPERRHRIPEAMRLYRSRRPGDAPWTDAAQRFRAAFSPGLATSRDEIEWRAGQGLGACHLLTIRYVGIWDTVGALGVPGHWRLLSRIFNRKYEFHDTALSSSVAAARHAVAIDERRKTYPPTMWSNLDRLNAAAGAARPYRQEWFPGTHGGVGGGGDIVGLSNAALLWVAEGAAEQGLAFLPEALDAARAAVDVTAPAHNHSAPPGLLWRLMAALAADRDGPADPVEVAEPARRRWRAGLDPAWRPAPLSRVAPALEAPEDQSGTR